MPQPETLAFPDSDFWNFSTRLYQQPGIEECCLQLQDDFQLNVNLLLLSAWVSSTRVNELTMEQWQALVELTSPYQEIILPLRQSRRFIKNNPMVWTPSFSEQTRKSISEIEIDAEHLEQLAIQKYYDAQPISKADNSTLATLFSNNLKNYLAAIEKLEKQEEILLLVDPLIQACSTVAT